MSFGHGLARLAAKLGWLGLTLPGAAGCSTTLDAGSDRLLEEDATDSQGNVTDLPFESSSPVIINNDGPVDNWQGEYALLSAAAGLDVVGLVINQSGAWPDLESNVSGWQRLVDAARASGIAGIPEPLASRGPPLARPTTGNIDDTEPNQSEGAQFILQAAASIDPTAPPLVIATGGRLTDVADAYLMDATISERIVVVSSLGQLSTEGARMGIPNGEMDTWADTIVAQRLRYVQVSGYYDQGEDVPDSRLAELPGNAFGDWIAEKQPQILHELVAADQVSVLAVALSGFVRDVARASAGENATPGSGEGPKLVNDAEGSAWLVTDVDGSLGTERFWELLGSVF